MEDIIIAEIYDKGVGILVHYNTYTTPIVITPINKKASFIKNNVGLLFLPNTASDGIMINTLCLNDSFSKNIENPNSIAIGINEQVRFHHADLTEVLASTNEQMWDEFHKMLGFQ